MLGVDYREIEVPVNIRKNIAENYNEEIIKQCEIGMLYCNMVEVNNRFLIK